MATYTVTETTHHGSFNLTVTASGKNLFDPLREILNAPNGYNTVQNLDAIVAEFTGRGFADALKPVAEFGWATYRLTITPDPED